MMTGPDGMPDMIPDICTINFVTEQDKECQICATRALMPFTGNPLSEVNVRLDAITSQTTDALGLTALCELEGQDLRDEWCDSVANDTNDNFDDSNEIFNDCLDAAGFGGDFPTEGECITGLTAGNVESQSSASDSALQTSSSNMQPNNLESQKFNQNVEVNKNMEQPKKTSILPWFKFNHQ